MAHQQAAPGDAVLVRLSFGSLEFEHLETPELEPRRKMRLEMYFAIGHRLFGL